jgi:myo-inositol catabolism protein IolC
MKGYPNDLYILAFDHRGTLTKGLLGVEGRAPTDEETARVSSMKDIIFDGFLEAKNNGISGGDPAILVDEAFGLQVQEKAKEMGIKFAAPAEKSGQKIFDFEYGENFGEKIKEVNADFVKILVRWNPDDDVDTRKIQGERIKTLSDWLDENERKFLLEFLVPASEQQLESVGGDQARYDSEIRPKLAVQVVEEMRERGADPDIWKIEGLDTANDCENVSKVIKDGGREDVIAVVLGRGANNEKVNEWLRAGSSVDGYKGFAIGRSIFWDSLKEWHAGEKSREEAVSEIANSYLTFISVYQNGS